MVKGQGTKVAPCMASCRQSYSLLPSSFRRDASFERSPAAIAHQRFLGCLLKGRRRDGCC